MWWAKKSTVTLPFTFMLSCCEDLPYESICSLGWDRKRTEALTFHASLFRSVTDDCEHSNVLSDDATKVRCTVIDATPYMIWWIWIQVINIHQKNHPWPKKNRRFFLSTCTVDFFLSHHFQCLSYKTTSTYGPTGIFHFLITHLFPSVSSLFFFFPFFREARPTVPRVQVPGTGSTGSYHSWNGSPGSPHPAKKYREILLWDDELISHVAGSAGRIERRACAADRELGHGSRQILVI